MKNVILACVLLAAVVGFSVQAWTGHAENKQEVTLKTLPKEEVKALEGSFEHFSQIETIELVAVKGEQFVKVTGLSLDNESLVMMEGPGGPGGQECGDCHYEEGENLVPGIIRTYYQAGVGTVTYCGTCEEDYNWE